MLRSTLCTFAIIALVGVVLFSGFVHAVIPHSHENDVVWQELHIVAQGAYKAVTVSAWLVLLAVLISRIQVAPESHYIVAIPQYISRGIAKHRRFG